jgi:[acyl-carrier-protein] S-malonyltransferase
MGKDFYDRSSLAREIFGRADETLGYKISRLCFEGPEEELRLTENTQPALLIVSTIAYRLWGGEASIAAGHSLGEYSALVAAGGLDFEEALVLVHKRGRYMQESVPVGVGAMAAILGSSYEAVSECLAKVKTGVVDLANWNSQEQIVIAGHKEAVEEAIRLINPSRSVFLPVSAPFHSRLMKTAEDKLAQDLEGADFHDLAFPLVTNVDAKIIQKAEEARDSLKRQVSRPVLWHKSMEVLGQHKIDVCLELGSGKVLAGLMKRIARGWPTPPVILSVENWDTLEKARQVISGLL